MPPTRAALGVLFATVALLVWACDSPQPGGVPAKEPMAQSSPAEVTSRPGAGTSGHVDTAPSSAAASGELVASHDEPTLGPSPANTPPKLFVMDVAALRELEHRGFDFASVALGAPARRASRLSAADYARHQAYTDLADVIVSDLTEFMRRDKRLGVGMRHAHRSFDPTWLTSPQFRFELAGIVNRIDRKAFAKGTCGEIRFIYRLTYAARVHEQDIESRVPMTLNAVRWLPSDGQGCRLLAARWRTPDGSGAELADALTSESGPLHALTADTKIKSLEVNMQSVRWPSTVRPNMAGHAEYVLRVFAPREPTAQESLRYQPSGLENTPDNALRAAGQLRSDFLAWLRSPSTLRELDRGTLLMPERFLAKRAVSVAPHGLARHANRPASQVVSERDLDGLDLSTYQTIQSAEMLRRRLDGLSCQGCHQTHGVAGFHFLGLDDVQRRADIVAVAHSRHFGEDAKRRERYLEALLSGQAPDELRLPTERMTSGDYGAHCGIDPSGAFATWTCDDGLTCVQLDDPDVGICQPVERAAGDACELGRMRASEESHKDYVALRPELDCGVGRVCEHNGVGFPGGMCSADCSVLGERESCGAIAQLVAFNSCLARQQAFESCILDNTRPGALRACSEEQPCREDYICARMPNGSGGCIPPYFLFQMRVDGHVLQ